MRKRIGMTVMCALLAVSMVGCSASGDATQTGPEDTSAQETSSTAPQTGGEDQEEEQKTTPEETSAEETSPEETSEENSGSDESGEGSENVSDLSGAEGIMNAILDQATTVVKDSLMIMPIDLENVDDVSYNLGLDSADGIAEAVNAGPLMSSIALSITVVTLEDGADAEGLKQELFDNADPRKWICVTAEKVYAVQSDLGILVVMAGEDVCQEVMTIFEDISGEMVGEPLSRDGEIGGGDGFFIPVPMSVE